MARISKNCKACDKPFDVKLSDHKRGWGNTCSKSCAAAYKCGMRPRDVNAHHAGYSIWAKERMDELTAAGVTSWPKMPSVQSQVGKVKVKPIYHSPCKCPECGNTTNGPGLCFDCDLTDIDGEGPGWDAHKGY